MTVRLLVLVRAGRYTGLVTRALYAQCHRPSIRASQASLYVSAFHAAAPENAHPESEGRPGLAGTDQNARSPLWRWLAQPVVRRLGRHPPQGQTTATPLKLCGDLRPAVTPHGSSALAGASRVRYGPGLFLAHSGETGAGRGTDPHSPPGLGTPLAAPCHTQLYAPCGRNSHRGQRHLKDRTHPSTGGAHGGAQWCGAGSWIYPIQYTFVNNKMNRRRGPRTPPVRAANVPHPHGVGLDLSNCAVVVNAFFGRTVNAAGGDQHAPHFQSCRNRPRP